MSNLEVFLLQRRYLCRKR